MLIGGISSPGIEIYWRVKMSRLSSFDEEEVLAFHQRFLGGTDKVVGIACSLHGGCCNGEACFQDGRGVSMR